jgi:uncharacterized cupredoxin-like copper-binding protein
MRKMMLAAAMVGAVGLLAGCSSGPKTVEVVVTNMAYKSKQIVLKQGETVRLVLNNRDKVFHDISIETIPIDVIAATAAPENAGHSHGDKEPDLHVAANPGEKGWIEFIPQETGTYHFICKEEGHLEKGMEGTLIVTADGKAPKQ